MLHTRSSYVKYQTISIPTQNNYLIICDEQDTPVVFYRQSEQDYGQYDVCTDLFIFFSVISPFQHSATIHSSFYRQMKVHF